MNVELNLRFDLNIPPIFALGLDHILKFALQNMIIHALVEIRYLFLIRLVAEQIVLLRIVVFMMVVAYLSIQKLKGWSFFHQNKYNAVFSENFRIIKRVTVLYTCKFWIGRLVRKADNCGSIVITISIVPVISKYLDGD